MAHVADTKKVHLDDLYSKSEKALIREAVQEVDMGSANAHAVRFPASDAARAALASGDRLVVLSLELAKETIELVSTSSKAAPSDLQVDPAEPRFLVFRWEHEHNGESFDSKIFVYSCPDAAPVKAKMMYSTVKSIAVELAGKVDLKLEVTENDDLSEENLLRALHPAVAEARVSNRVTKPKGPGRPRQLIK
jgi:twinfilin-like protein